MLQFLRIEHFLHVDHAEISFGEGLHCITGESGSGKTVILKALKLLLGEKPPPNAVSQNAPQAIIEAAFDTSNLPSINTLLDKAGISYDKEEWLLIKRIIPQDSRSRLYINSQTANSALLEKLGTLLVEIVDQNAGKQLLSSDYQRHLLDTYGQHQKEKNAYVAAYSLHQRECERLETLKKETPESLETLLWQKEELEKHNIHTIDVEEELSKHEKYSNAEELADTLSQVVATLREHISSQLLQMSRLLEKCAEKDPTLNQAAEHLQTAQLEIEEAASIGEHYLDSLHFDPEEFSRLEELSNFLTLFKRKHGINYENITTTYHSIITSIATILDRDKRIDTQIKAVKNAESELKQAANALSTARRKAASTLQVQAAKTLHALKVDDATFLIQVEKELCKRHGQDTISFTLKRGASQSSIRQVASGGELSRILLAIKAHIATKQTTPTLIFDEIDSNIGGETANVVADLLSDVAKGQQLLTITHFPQVAAKADHHIVVEKTVKNGVSTGTIRLLTSSEKKGELLRMVGGKSSAPLLRDVF